MNLRIALQSGAMKGAMMSLFESAFLPIQQENESSFDGTIQVGDQIVSDHRTIEVRFMKSASVPEQVVSGDFDCGITGLDVIYQACMEGRVENIVELPLARRTNQSARVVLVGLKGARFNGCVIIYADREYSRIAEELIQGSTQVQAELKLQDGTSEEKVRSLNDFAVVATETGSSLKANGLDVFRNLIESCMVLFVRKELCESHEWKFPVVEELGWLLQGVLEARPRVLLKMNIIDDNNLKAILVLLPSLTLPTQMSLGIGGYALEAVVFAEHIALLIPKLKRAGASGILVQDLQMVVL